MLQLNNISEKEALSFLPGKFVHEFGGLLSLEAIEFLINKYGGTRIYIAKLNNSTLAGMSQKDIDVICKYAGGTDIEVPTGDRLRRRLRDKEIFESKTIRGVSVSLLARKHKMSERNIRRITSNYLMNKQ